MKIFSIGNKTAKIIPMLLILERQKILTGVFSKIESLPKVGK